MNEVKFIKQVQCKVAVSAVGPSALRGQGTGVLYSVQKRLKNIDLSSLPTENQEEFKKWLDQQTDAILRKLPVDNKPWGAARKALNLFLRDVLY